MSDLDEDTHGYPEMVSLRSNCVYAKHELVCMDCWLYYRQTGTHSAGDVDSSSSLDEISFSKDDESSEDEYSPYHIHL